jgi:hypothetical protein
MRNIAQGSVVLECKSAESTEIVKQEVEAKLGNDYEVSIVGCRKPEIKMLKCVISVRVHIIQRIAKVRFRSALTVKKQKLDLIWTILVRITLCGATSAMYMIEFSQKRKKQ